MFCIFIRFQGIYFSFDFLYDQLFILKFSVHSLMFVYFLVFVHFLVFQLHSLVVRKDKWYDFNWVLKLVRVTLWLIFWPILEKFPWNDEKNVHSVSMGWSVVYISIRSILSIVWVRPVVPSFPLGCYLLIIEEHQNPQYCAVWVYVSLSNCWQIF